MLLSPRLVTAMGARVTCDPAATPREPAASPDMTSLRIALFAIPDGGRNKWHANHPWFAEQIGSLEANYTWYPTWIGKHEKQRVALVDADSAQQLGLDLSKYRVCRAAP